MIAVANLIVRNLDKRVVDALKIRAAKHGRSAEAEHRALLEELLLLSKPKTFAAALLEIPASGRDEDFERVGDEEEAKNVFG